MSRTRVVGLLIIAAMAASILAPGLASAGGGFAPPPPGFVLNTTKDVSAVVVLDPHGPVVFGTRATATGTFGAITLNRKHFAPASAVFKVPGFGSLGELALGCDLSASTARFVTVPLNGWMSQELLEILFQQVGITIGPLTAPVLVPAVTQIVSQQCSPAPPPDDTAFNPGFLVMEVKIGFFAAPGTPIPK